MTKTTTDATHIQNREETGDQTCERLEAEILTARRAGDEVARAALAAALSAAARYEARVVVNAETTYSTIGNIKTWAARKRATEAAAIEAGQAARAKFFAQNPKWAGRAGARRVRVELVDLTTGLKTRVPAPKRAR